MRLKTFSQFELEMVYMGAHVCLLVVLSVLPSECKYDLGKKNGTDSEKVWIMGQKCFFMSQIQY